MEHFLDSEGIPDRTNPQYSAYVVWTKWLANVDEAEIDNSCQVYSSNLPSKMYEMYRLLDVCEKLAVSKAYDVSQAFQTLKERIRYGVREEELPFVKISGIGRETVKGLHTFCSNLRTNLGYSGTMVEILKSFLIKEGDEKFLNIIKEKVSNVGEIRAMKILSKVKSV